MKFKNARFAVEVNLGKDFVEIEVERLKAEFDKALIIRIGDQTLLTCPGNDLADARAKMNKPW